MQFTNTSKQIVSMYVLLFSALFDCDLYSVVCVCVGGGRGGVMFGF